MAEPSVRSYAGKSKEERVERRRIDLMQAAMTISEKAGWKQISVDRLCQEAQLNKRYFYESFSDLDTLASAVVDYVAKGVSAVLQSAMKPGLTIPDLAHAVIGAFVRYITDIPCRARLLFGELMMSDTTESHRKLVVLGIVAEVTRHARDIHRAHDVNDSIIETSAIFLVGGTGQVILSWLDGHPKVSRERLIDDLTSLWLITGDGAAAYSRNRISESPSISKGKA